MGEMFSGFEHGFVLVVSFEFVADDLVPEAVLVVVEVDG